MKKLLDRSISLILVLALLFSLSFTAKTDALAADATEKATVLLVESGVWEVPIGVGEIHAVVIGGGSPGQRGNTGSNGGAGGNGVAGSAGRGGSGGSGGLGGNIYEYTASVKEGQVFNVSIGSSGEETVFGTVSSASGTRSYSGYTDSSTGTVYALPGQTGTSGSNGIDGSIGITPLYIKISSASNVTYSVIEAVAYAGRANNKTMASVRNTFNTTKKTVSLSFNAPDGTNGSTGWTGSAGKTYGSGGNGGEGGNGGNGGAGYRLNVGSGSSLHFKSGGYTDTITVSGISNDTSSGGKGGSGGAGGSGANGCVIIYCSEPQGSVTFDTKGGSVVSKQEGIKIGTTATEPTPPTKAGYDFSGWYADEACTSFYDFNTPVTDDITIYAKWLPRNDTPYKVQHYQQDVSGSGYTIFETDSFTGTTGTGVSAATKEYPGFHENTGYMDRLASGTIAPDGSTTLLLYYDRDSHSVTFDSAGGSTVDPQSVRYGANAALPTQPTRQGYQFADWYPWLCSNFY